MSKVMVENSISCNSPVRHQKDLLQPGAQKLTMTFRLRPSSTDSGNRHCQRHKAIA